MLAIDFQQWWSVWPRFGLPVCGASNVSELRASVTSVRRRYAGAAPSFNEVFAQGADPGGSEGGARGEQTQALVEHVGGGGQKIAQLIGEEAAAPAQLI
jgi:hypothetical protein